MKKRTTFFILLFLVLIFGASLYYLFQKNSQSPIIYATEQPETKTIIKNTVATGSIVPKEEVLIKPNISGIVEEIYVEAGDDVKTGDPIAKVRVVPNISNLSGAQNQLVTAKIALDNETKLYNRQKTLFDKGVISANDYDTAEAAYKQAQQSYNAARQSVEIVRTGTSKGFDNVANTMIRSTVSGMVLEVPIKVGNQIIESNNFNEGTTIVSLADVNNMIFQGKLDESEVGKIKLGLPLEITIGAVEDKKFDAVLDYIAPKGVAENGAVQFAIKGTLKNRDATFIRAGLSANASIILGKAENVIAIKEALLQFDGKTQKPFVEVEKGAQQFERREVELGISDGIYVEIKKGISKNDKIKVWNQVKQ